jgi:hypothetical protein
MVGQRSSNAPVSRSEPSTSVHSANGRLLVTSVEDRSYRWLRNFDKHFGASLRQRYESEFVNKC